MFKKINGKYWRSACGAGGGGPRKDLGLEERLKEP